MEPRIQYAKTSDGVNIAFSTMGAGTPLFEMPGVPGHIQLEWQIPEVRRWLERLAEKRKLVRFDGRGEGLSDRDVTDVSLDAGMLDLEAVVERLDLGELSLFGRNFAGPLAISYAARYPESVSHLILSDSFARASDILGTAQVQGLLSLMDKDWELFTDTFAHVGFGWSAGEPAQRYAELLRESITPEYLRASVAAFSEVDVTDLLPQVRCPTLVLHHRQQGLGGVDVAKALASRIPDARLVLLEGDSVAGFIGNPEAVLTAIDEFLGDGEGAGAGVEPTEPGAFRTILFTDVEGSTALTDRLGDAKARELLREHERMVREALKANGGSEVKTMGDGFMASFGSATKALDSAIAMQSAFAVRNESAEEPINVRIGLNAGEPIAEDDPSGRGDLFGTAVNMAARIAAKAEGGEILVADVVRQLVAGKEFLFNDRGDTELRGFEDPVRVYEVRWRKDG